MLNKVFLIGNLGANPESKTFGDNGNLVNFRIAVSRSYKDKSGNWQEHTNWISCTAFGPLAQRIAKNLERGNQVLIEGSLETRKYQAEGEEKESTYTNVLVSKYRKLKGEKSRAQMGAEEADLLEVENVEDPNYTDANFDDGLPF